MPKVPSAEVIDTLQFLKDLWGSCAVTQENVMERSPGIGSAYMLARGAAQAFRSAESYCASLIREARERAANA